MNREEQIKKHNKNVKLDRDKTYYDVTHENEPHPDSRGVCEIIWTKYGWECVGYDYVLTDEQLLEGLREGWAEAEAE